MRQQGAPGRRLVRGRVARQGLGGCRNATKNCDVFLVVGTSAVVYPAAGLVPLAKSAGARVIEVNLEATPMSGVVEAALSGLAGEILPQLLL
jgi:NAD-dependent SIR2 family protein deacetylase